MPYVGGLSVQPCPSTSSTLSKVILMQFYTLHVLIRVFTLRRALNKH